MTVTIAAILMAFSFALGWRAARRAQVAAAPSPEAFEAACLAAARVYYLDRFTYPERGYIPGGRDEHIERDVRDTADEPWLRAVVRAALDTAEDAR